MNERVVCWRWIACACWMLLLGFVPASVMADPEPIPEVERDDSETSTDCAGKVCPLYEYMHMPAYCSYYAQHCDVPNQYGLLESPHIIPAGGCVSPCPATCVTGPASTVRDDKDAAVRRRPPLPIPHPGIGLPAPKNPNAMPRIPDAKLATILGQHFVKFPDPHSTDIIYAKVFLVLVNPKAADKQGPPLVLGNGFQVRQPPKVDFDLSGHPKMVRKIDDSSAVHLELGSVTYQVILVER